MYLNPRDEEIIDTIISGQRVTVQAAAYLVYVELTSSNKKPISHREFHTLFKDNLDIFEAIEGEEYGEVN